MISASHHFEFSTSPISSSLHLAISWYPHSTSLLYPRGVRATLAHPFGPVLGHFAELKSPKTHPRLRDSKGVYDYKRSTGPYRRPPIQK
jgi:hypothetical protein